MDKTKAASILLRIGLAIVFFYAAIGSLTAPEAWAGYLPAFLTNIFPASGLLLAFSLYEILLGVWILWGIKARWSGALAALTMVGIIASNLAAMDVVFRDFAILFAALALATLG